VDENEAGQGEVRSRRDMDARGCWRLKRGVTPGRGEGRKGEDRGERGK